MKTKLKFNADGVVNGKVVFEAGKVYEISNETGSVDRWIKRGAEVVLEEVVVESAVSNVEPVVEVAVEEVVESAEETASEEIVVNKEDKKENKKSKTAKVK
jgi:hypothetical protein